MSMTTNPTAPSIPPASDAPKMRDAGSQVMGKEDFLRLLVTQLGNQDPLNPMDGQQFAAQLAQFSSVEQLLNISEAMAGQTEMSGLMSQNINSSMATGLIGKDIEAISNQVNLKGGSDTAINFELASGAAEVTVVVKNEGGQVVRSFEMAQVVEGPVEIPWDGKNLSGTQLPDGRYTFEVSAADANGDTVNSIPKTGGQVDRVSFGPEGILLWIDRVSVPIGSVVSVHNTTND